MKPSHDHPNRRSHNWLVYYRHDQSLVRYADRLFGSVFDLGAGACSYRRWCLEHADSYAGVDWPGSMHQGEIDVFADLNEPLPIDSRSCDSLLCFSVLEHLHQPQNLLSEAHRLLKPGGWLLLQTPWQWWVHEEPHDYFRYTPFALIRLLEEAGFDASPVEAQGGFFTTLALKLNYFSLRFIRGPKFVRAVIRALLWLPWQLSQWAALLLDRLDLHPELEASAYFVVARRPAHTTGAPKPVRQED